ncbi:MAG: alpha/beta hydrolase [Candidatus Bathyarchaeia archaeon]
MPYLLVNDINLYYEEIGKGETLILLHGLLGSMEDWRRFIPLFSKYYRVIAVDLRGHGRTNNPKGELSNNLFCSDLTGLLDMLHLESVLICGYSLGGYVGLMAALAQPFRIKALVMHASKMFWNDDIVGFMLQRLNPDRILAKTPRFAETLQKMHGRDRWILLLKEASEYLQTMPNEVLGLKDFGRVNIPVLVSVGDRDELVPVEEAVRFYHALQRGELLVMPNTRHSLDTVRERVFIQAILDFLTRVQK